MSLKVLTVDDSKTIRMIVKKAFMQYNCSLSDAENGVDGLALAQKEKPDLIILDITMPVMNGIEMLGKLKEDPNLKDTPVVMLTAESGKDNVMKIVSMGVRDYMVKPFKGEQLIDRVKNIIPLEPKIGRSKSGDDTSKKYFLTNGDAHILALPDKINRPVTVVIEGHLKVKLKEMQGSGMKKFILDTGACSEINMSLIKLIILTIQMCQSAQVRLKVIGNSALHNELKGFQETSNIQLYDSIDAAKAAF